MREVRVGVDVVGEGHMETTHLDEAFSYLNREEHGCNDGFSGKTVDSQFGE